MAGSGAPSVLDSLRELTRHRDLILSFAIRDIRARYKQTALGIGWAVLHPFSLMVIFTLVFSKLARVPSDGVPYPLFVYSGLIFWTFFAASVSQGTIAMVANGSLVRKIYFPRETLLIAVLLAAGLDWAIASAIFVGMLFYYQASITWAMAWVVPLIILQVMFTLGVICLTSAINVYLRDIGTAMPLLLQLWMFATPVAYPLSVVPAWLAPLYLLNPMAPVIDGYRRAILRGEPPDLVHLGVGFAIAVGLLAGAYVWFKRAERTFADVI
jgi:ABC-type polysaccharide/polyol phosphate export permease